MFLRNLLFYTLFLGFVQHLSAQQTPIFKIEHIEETYVLLDPSWKFHLGDQLDWKSPDWDDSQWDLLPINKKWTRAGYPGQGIVWYRLTFEMPPIPPKKRLSIYVPSIVSAIEVYFNGELVGKRGKPSALAEDEILSAGPFLVSIPEELLQQTQQHTIAFRVSNHQHSSGFIYGSPAIGSEVVLQNREFFSFLGEGCFLGLIFTSFIYHFLIFLGRRKDWNYFYFACLTFSLLAYFVCNISFSEAVANSVVLFHYKIKLEYLSVPCASIANLLFFLYQFDFYDKRPVYIYGVVSGLLFLLILLTPTSFFTQLLPWIHLYLLVGIFIGLYIILKSLKSPGAVPIILASVVFFGCVLVDILMIYLSFRNLNLVKFGFAFCILALSMSLAEKFNYTNHIREQLQASLLEQNRIFQLFVPPKYLKRITYGGGIDSIRVGNAEEAIVTILFSDIRGFTSFAEDLNPKDVLLFLNEYFEEMGYCIQFYEGLIDKYIGDAIMAVFDSHEVEPPLMAAIQMQLALKEFNQNRPHRPPLEIGIGLNTGRAIMGTIGSQSRMDSSVIGDSVNLASRLESLTKIYHTPILVSEFTLKRLTRKDLFHFRKIDRVRVKGRQQEVEIFEIFTTDEPALFEQKKQGLALWEEALHLYFTQQSKPQTLELFLKYHQQYPLDCTAEIFIERCKRES